jgi:cytochrome P450
VPTPTPPRKDGHRPRDSFSRGGGTSAAGADWEVLLHPFDPGDPHFLADPYAAFAALRALGPVHAHPLLGIPVAVSHAACSELLRSRDLGRIWVDAEPAADFPAFNLLHRNSLLEREGPAHNRLRTLVASAFNRGHTARLEPWVRGLAHRLVGELAERIAADGSADLMAGVAAALPVEVIAELLGVPEPQRGALRGWSNAIVTMYEPDPGQQRRIAAEQAAAEFVDALRELVAHRRTHPGDDLVTDLVEADVDADELVGTAALLLMAGHEATVNVIGNGVLALLRHPAQWQRLREDPGLDATAVVELIRYDPPLQLFERTAVVDATVAGHPVPAGTMVAALLGAAARDPQAFDRPDELDVGRRRNPHLGFGAGVHYCLGAPLARLEVLAALDALRVRLPGMQLANEPVRRPDFVMRGLRELRLAA